MVRQVKISDGERKCMDASGRKQNNTTLKRFKRLKRENVGRRCGRMQVLLAVMDEVSKHKNTRRCVKRKVRREGRGSKDGSDKNDD